MSYRYEVILALALLAAALVAGLWIGALGWSLFVAALLWIASQWNQYRKLSRWARRPLALPPDARASWYELAARPYRVLQSQRQRSRRHLQRMREVLGLVEVIPDAVVIVDANADIEGFNAAARHLLHLNDSDRGLGLGTVVRNPEFVKFLRQPQRDNILEFPSPFDQDKSLEARKFEVDEGRMVVIVRDNTELNRLLTMRQSFVANVSHELRTPLTVVAGYLETITDVSQPEDLRLALIDKIAPPIGRMQSLVGDLLTLTRLESSPVPDELASLSMPQIIHGAVQESQGLTTAVGQLQVECSTERRIAGIEKEIFAVCVNLIGNALRYSPEGTPVVVSWREVDGKGRLTIKDNGIGIAPEHLSRITERFYRVDMKDSRTRGGTGLGLAIVKHALLRHQSELKVESTVGEGSKFYCDFELTDVLDIPAGAVNE